MYRSHSFWRAARLAVFSILVSTSAWAQVVVTGIVRQADGAPVTGATVTISPQGLSTQTDANGTYRIEQVTPGTWSRVSVRQGIAKEPLASRVALISLSTERVDITVEAAGALGDASGNGGIRGVVLSSDGLPVPGARVALDVADVATVADASGAFSLLGLRTDQEVSLLVTAPGFSDGRLSVTVPKGAPATVNVMLGVGATSQAITTPGDVPILSASGASSTIAVRTQDAGTLPSFEQGDARVVIRSLPSADGTQDATGGLFVRGGLPGNTQLSLDTFTLYNSDHLAGYVGALNPDAVDRVEFSPDALEPQSGGRLTGAIHVVGKDRETVRPSGYADISGISAGGMLSASAGSRASFLVAGRKSVDTELYRNLAGLFSSNGVLYQTTPDSEFDDLNGKVTLRPTSRDRLSATFYNGRDTIDTIGSLGVSTLVSSLTYVAGTSTLSNGADGLTLGVSAEQRGENRGVGGSWTHVWNTRSQTQVTFGRSNSSATRADANALTSVLTDLDYSYDVGRGAAGAQGSANDIEDRTASLTTTVGLGAAHTVLLGGSLSQYTMSFSASTSAAVKSTSGIYTPRSVTLLSRAQTGRTTSGFVQDTWTPIAGLTIAPGVRITRYDVTGETFAEPRVSATVELLPGLQVKAGYAHGSQMATTVLQEDRWQGNRTFWTLADGADVPVAQSRRASASASLRNRYVLLDLSLYRSTFDNLTWFAPRLTPGDAPLSPSAAFFAGAGTARGVEVLFQHRSPRQNGSISYTLSQSEQLFPGLEALSFAAPDDERHRVKAVESVNLYRGLNVAATWWFGSGRPYTRGLGIDAVLLPVGLTVDRVLFSSINTGRLPRYQRLDLSAQENVTLFGIRTTVGATAYNVLDRSNVGSYTYQTFGGLATRASVSYLPRAFNAFLKVGF
ncbi:MAG: TonB-dependent receptor [Vicinamibacterales bacterium]